jgi:RNA polymerase sigma-70 factor (ECF subfamily)
LAVFYGTDVDRKPELLQAYLAERSVLKRFLIARIGNEEDAEEAIQELWLRLSRTELTDDIRSPNSYFFKMALNIARDLRRSRNRSHARDASWVESMHVVAGTEMVDNVASADTAYHAKQRLAAVNSALNELSPQCRRVFVLHKFDGLSHADISARVGIARSTVEKHMTTALKHLVKRVGRD